MKRAKICILTVLFLLPALIFCGCGDTKYFTITSSVSNGDLGSVSIGSGGSYAEGTQVNLTASPKENNKFVCWIKNYELFYSKDSSLNLTANESTQGNYTAVFEESDISSMRYAMLSGINYSGDYSQINFTVTYYPIDNSGLVRTLASGTVDHTNTKLNSNIIRLFEESSPINFRFSVTMEIINSAGTGSVRPEFTNIDLSNAKFVSGQFECTLTDGLTLTFSKLSSSLFD